MGRAARTVLLCLLLCLAAAVAQAQQVQLGVLVVNDFHGALAAEEGRPGAAVLAAAIERQRAKNPQGTVLLAAGDMLQGSVDSNLLFGRTVIEMMNALRFDAMALGNHEFDWGLPVLGQRAREARFPLVCANVEQAQGGSLLPLARPYVLLERQGVKIAVIGATTTETASKSHPKAVAGLRFAEPATAVSRYAREARRQGADIVIALTHLSSYSEAQGDIGGEAAELAAKAEEVDVVVSAHSHQRVAGLVQGVMVLQADAYGRGLGKLNLTYDTQTKALLLVSAGVEDVAAQSLPPDRRMQALVQRQEAPLLALKRQVVGFAKYPLEHDRARLSVLGQWVADSMREAAQADIAFLNGGGVRRGLPAGTLSLEQVYAALPFDNTLYTVQLTGGQVKQVLEHGLYNRFFGMLQFSGLTVVVDASQPPGQRVVEARLAGGEPLVPTGRYQVVANDFMAAGGDGYTVLQQGLDGVDTYILLREAVLQRLKRQGPLDFTGDGRLLERHGDSLRLPDAA